MDQITIDRAIIMLRKEYEEAKRLEYVNKPLAFALYQVWKAVDVTERRERK